MIDTSKRKLNEAIASIISLVPQSDRRDEALVKQYVSKAVHPTDDFSKLEVYFNLKIKLKSVF